MSSMRKYLNKHAKRDWIDLTHDIFVFAMFGLCVVGIWI